MNDLVVFHPETLAFSRPAIPGLKPPARHEHAATAFHNHLWLYGGGSDGGYMSYTWVYSPTDARWARPSFTGDAPSGRKGHKLAAIGSSLYVWGGCAAHCFDVSMYVLDVEAGKWEKRVASSGAPPTAREGHAMVVVHERLIIVGGCDGKKGRCYGGVHVYDPVRDLWSQPTLLASSGQPALSKARARRDRLRDLPSTADAASRAASPPPPSPTLSPPPPHLKGSFDPSGLCSSGAWSLTAHFTSLTRRRPARATAAAMASAIGGLRVRSRLLGIRL